MQPNSTERTMIPGIIDKKSSICLLYHDIVDRANTKQSGNVTEGASRYKTCPDTFRSHLETIQASEYTVRTIPEEEHESVYLTFDDGGSSMMHAASLLEEYNMRGHFFIITDRIGDDRYLSWPDVRELATRGHVVGSHTVTHADLTGCTPSGRQHELLESKRRIADELNSCDILSIPRGRYNNDVYSAAKEAGYEYILTSEPRRVASLDTRTLGRWNIWADTTCDEVHQILSGAPLYYLRVAGRWRALTLLKSALGLKRYLRLRNAVLRHL